MKVLVCGKEINITDKTYIAQGGQASVYGIGNKIFKIYTDPNDMIPIAKINELQQLKESYIINPQDIIFNQQKHPIGYTMSYCKNSVPLCKLFTRDFRNRFNI